MNPFAVPPSLCLPLNTPIHLFPIPASLSNRHPKPLHPNPPRPYPKLPLPASLSPLSASPTSFPYSFPDHVQRKPDQEEEDEDEDDDDHAIGDCLVFEDGAFEGVADPFLRPDPTDRPRRAAAAAAAAAEVNPETLVPEKWKEAAAELNLTKKEKRKMAHQIRFGSRVERRRKLPMPDIEEYRAYREMKMDQLKPVVLDDPRGFLSDKEAAAAPQEMEGPPSGRRVAPRNPRLGLGGGTMEDITDFFNSRYYLPGELNDDKKPQGSRKLLTKEEKILLNKRIPNLADATSNKWMPLHTLAASGEFYLLDMLLKHNVDINAVDKDGLSAIHRAIIGKKQAIVNYLLRNSANPFVRDTDGATLIHHAVQTASSQTIKILLLYNIDINAADNDGWTPLHLAVQTQRTDIVRLLLIKGADMTLKNRDGLTPLDLCLYSGHGMRTYEIIKLLKKQPKSKLHP